MDEEDGQDKGISPQFFTSALNNRSSTIDNPFVLIGRRQNNKKNHHEGHEAHEGFKTEMMREQSEEPPYNFVKKPLLFFMPYMCFMVNQLPLAFKHLLCVSAPSLN